MLSLSFYLLLISPAALAFNAQIIATGPLESTTLPANVTKLSIPSQALDTKSEPLLKVETHIFAGEKAEVNEFPWIVKSASPTATCTGVLIHEGKQR